MASPVKILVTGDVDGRFSQLFSRVAAVQTKNGPFEMLLCTGSFFGDDNTEWESYIKGTAVVPVTTYVLGPCKPEHEFFFPKTDGCELCHNVIYLGKRGIFAGSSGLKLAYVSGIEGSSANNGGCQFVSEDVASLQNQVENTPLRGVDILLTAQWPKYVAKFACPPKDIVPDSCESLLISQVAVHILPRYHFAGLADVHYERLPYRNHQVLGGRTKHATRFIALAKVGNTKKNKWLYAFSIIPLSCVESVDLTKQPPDVTECPYALHKELFMEKVVAPPQYFYSMDASLNDAQSTDGRKRHVQSREERMKQQKNDLMPSRSCWFCLGSSEVEKHLVICIGESTYLSLAKGALIPQHVLILPIGHAQSTVELDCQSLQEINKFKEALIKLFRSQDKTAVFYERNFKSSHLQIQVIPLPSRLLPNLKRTFYELAATNSIELEEIPPFTDLKQIVHSGSQYFYVELESGERLLNRIRGNFPLNFGREVLASPAILNMPDRTDWRSCTTTREEDLKMVSAFRKSFHPYDFTAV